MKKVVLLLTMAVLAYGCIDGETYDPQIIEFTIFNETDHSIRILAYDTMDETSGEMHAEVIAANPIQINPDSEYSVMRQGPLEEALKKSFYSIEGVDYVQVIFNSERVVEYRWEMDREIQDNIFRGDEKCQHFISEADYTAAVDCEGNCN